jgi:hypothetical protein
MIITSKDWDKLRGSVKPVERTRSQLRLDLSNLNRKLKGKGYQKSTNKNKYYARMNDGLVPHDTPEEATAARRAEVLTDIERVQILLEESRI